MRRLVVGALAPLLMVACGSCKDQDTVAMESRAQTVEEKLEEGHGSLARGEYEKAARAYRAAAGETPKDPIPLLYLADAYKQGGNDAAAEITYRQADDLARMGDVQVKRRMVELFVKTAQPQRAIRMLQEQLANNALDPAEILELARLQASQKDRRVFKTLERYRAEKPEDLEADAVEAGAHLTLGEEMKAAQMMDELIKLSPDLPAARLLRARFFTKNGYPDLAEQDLNEIRGAYGERPEVIDVRATVYQLQGRKAEAEALLEQMIQVQPRSPDALARLAEMKLENGRADEAAKLAERALLMQPRFGRALFIRARVLEQGADLEAALSAYRSITRVDPSYGPAYTRLARLHHARGDFEAQRKALEKLVSLKQASVAEKAELAELYSKDPKSLRKGWVLIEEVLEAAPNDEHYLSLRDALKRGKPKPKKPLVIEVR